MGPLGTVFHTERRRANRAEQAFVKRESGPENRDALIQAGLGILLDEIDPHTAGQKEKDGVRLRCAQRCDFSGVIGLAQPGVDLACDIALVVAFKACQMVFPGRVIGSQQVDVFEAGIINILTDNLVKVVVLVRNIEVIFIAALTGKGRRPGVGTDVEDVIANDLRHDREGNIREDDAGHDLNVVPLDEAIGNLLGLARVATVIFDQQFHGNTTEFAVFLGNRQLEPITHLFTKITGLGRKRCNHTYLDRVCRPDCRGKQQHRQDQHHKQLFHCHPFD